jgi:hypothetical protein
VYTLQLEPVDVFLSETGVAVVEYGSDLRLRERLHAEHQTCCGDHVNGFTDGSQPLQVAQKECLRMVDDAEAVIHAATQEQHIFEYRTR